jgi:hypothetical protein
MVTLEKVDELWKCDLDSSRKQNSIRNGR